MAKGAPIGNTNAAGAERPFKDAIARACAQEDWKRLRAAAEKLLDLAANGEPWAIKELADRIDGKSFATTNVNVAGKGIELSNDELLAIASGSMV